MQRHKGADLGRLDGRQAGRHRLWLARLWGRQFAAGRWARPGSLPPTPDRHALHLCRPPRPAQGWQVCGAVPGQNPLLCAAAAARQRPKPTHCAGWILRECAGAAPGLSLAGLGLEQTGCTSYRLCGTLVTTSAMCVNNVRGEGLHAAHGMHGKGRPSDHPGAAGALPAVQSLSFNRGSFSQEHAPGQLCRAYPCPPDRVWQHPARWRRRPAVFA